MVGIISNQLRQIPTYGTCDGDGLTPKNKPPKYACDGDGLTPKNKPPRYACDGGGLTAKIANPQELLNDTVDFAGKAIGKAAGSIRDYVRKPAKNDASVATTPSMDAEVKKSNKKGNFLAAAILLLGGVALGYGHRKYIEKGFDNLGKQITKWTSGPKCQELIKNGKDLLAKAKDAIFVKA